MARPFFTFIVAILLFQGSLKGQPQETAPDTYILFLKDKNHNTYSLNNPIAFLSERAIERRTKQNININLTDLPVSNFYLDSLRKIGLQIHNVSRWFNSVTFKTNNIGLLNTVSDLNFVQGIRKSTPLYLKLNGSTQINHPESSTDSSAYGAAYRQIHIHNGDYLHQNGLKGENMLIAIIDAGFKSYKTLSSFQHIISEGRIIHIRDFVSHDGEVNSDHSHGTSVFSIIGGEIEKTYLGSSPKADFLLLRSEDATDDFFGGQREYLVEEDNWIAAAEYADSLGTDIINSSLGYSTFNDPDQNHTYQDLNGTSTRISRAADMAVEKGMIVVVSAGNEGDDPWHFISAPADARNVLAVGAVNTNLVRAGFSSVGPTADNRIKPDVMAVGWGTVFQSTNDILVTGNGTSFASPIIAGLTACLWQGAKDKTNLEVIRAIRRSSDLYANPNNNYGYGIPDFKRALFLLNLSIEDNERIRVFPNPFTSHLSILHEALNSSSAIIELYNMDGRKIYTKKLPVTPNVKGEIELTDVDSLPGGMVIIRVISGDKTLTAKAVKL